MKVYTVVKYKWKGSECSSCGTEYQYCTSTIEGLYNSLENAKTSIKLKKDQELVWRKCDAEEDVSQILYAYIEYYMLILMIVITLLFMFMN